MRGRQILWYNIHTEIAGGRRAAAAPFSGRGPRPVRAFTGKRPASRRTAVCRAGDHSRYGSLRRPPSGPPPIFLKTVQTIRTVSTAGAYRRGAALRIITTAPGVMPISIIRRRNAPEGAPPWLPAPPPERREARMCHPGARRLRRGRHRGRTVQGAVIRKEECVCGFSSRLDPRFSPV